MTVAQAIQNAPNAPYPELAGVGAVDAWDSQHGVWSTRCTGTMITNWYMLTAAHCLTPRALLNGPAYARVGAQRIGVQKMVLHPTLDVALLKLSTPMVLYLDSIQNFSSSGYYRPWSQLPDSAVDNQRLWCWGHGPLGSSAATTPLTVGMFDALYVPTDNGGNTDIRAYPDPANPSVQITNGDSGGPCFWTFDNQSFTTMYIAGVTVSVLTPFPSYHVGLEMFWDWAVWAMILS